MTYLLLLTLGTPAHAGNYELTSQYGTGSITRTPSGGGTPTTDPLSSPEITEYLRGSNISFSYTETFEYEWIPAEGLTLAEDPAPTASAPLDMTLEGEASIQLSETPSAEFDSGSGSASITIAGVTASASASVTGGVPGSFQEEGNGTTLVYKNYTVSGTTVTISVSYSGSCQLGPEGSIDAFLTLKRCPPNTKTRRCRPDDNIEIASPADGTPYGLTEIAEIIVDWRGGFGGDTYWVELWSHHPAETPKRVTLGPAVLIPPGGIVSRRETLEYLPPRDHWGNYTIEARLICQKAGSVTSQITATDWVVLFIRRY